VQEARGRSWFFFGERRFRTDFLYQAEWQQYLREGWLTRMDLAFSRDQAQKIYVQDRLRERGRDVYGWLQEGAYLYVCGDAKNMAPDVQAALIDIVATHGGKDQESAREYLNELTLERRYRRDVY
jgi:sulfite reductase (NADPH) flavoprotein alpha-component